MPAFVRSPTAAPVSSWATSSGSITSLSARASSSRSWAASWKIVLMGMSWIPVRRYSSRSSSEWATLRHPSVRGLR